MAAFEKDLIQDALKTTRGNRAKAARLLDTTERVLNTDYCARHRRPPVYVIKLRRLQALGFGLQAFENPRLAKKLLIANLQKL